MINVLPEQEKIDLRREYYMRVATVSLNILTLLSLLASLLLVPPYILSASKENSVKNTLAIINNENPEISLNDLNTFIEKINSTLSLFINNTVKRNVLEDVYMPVLNSQPSNISIAQLLFAEHGGNGVAELDLHGVAQDRDALQSFKDILIKSGKFTSVDIPISSFVKKNNIDFTVTLILK